MGSGGRFLLLLVVVALAVAAPSANSQILPVVNNVFVAVTRIVCTTNGNPCTNASTPVVGVPATLVCNGVTLGSAVSNFNGVITFVINRVLARFLGLRCSIVIPLTKNIVCSLLQGPGSLLASTTISSVADLPVGMVDGVPTQNLVGSVLPFTRIA